MSRAPDAPWSPLPAADWTDDAAAHLLRRTGWTARPADVARAVERGLPATLNTLFPATPPRLAKTEAVARFEADLPELLRAARRSSGGDRQAAQRELRERSQAALQDYRLHWLQFAADPVRSAAAKWGFFLSDVYVVSAEKVKNAALIAQHIDILAVHAFGRAPDLTKAVSRSPAMVRYLDLDKSDRAAPNENFARELFELFVLGEGHYTEADIKEAARAFTGYRVHPATGEFRIAPRQQDRELKTVFGRSGAFSGDDVIDLAYAQPAAAGFLPRELLRFYLTEQPLPADDIAALGALWREQQFDLRWLAHTVFGSRRFFAPEYRGTLIKSPVQFCLGLAQDLELDVPPLPRFALNPLRQMAQLLFQPPNVRGWVGGRSWINSGTLAARRNHVRLRFTPLREATLNADEQQALARAREAGLDRFTVDDAWLDRLRGPTPDALARELVQRFLPAAPTPALAAALAPLLAATPATHHGLRTALAALLQTPEYQLC